MVFSLHDICVYHIGLYLGFECIHLRSHYSSILEVSVARKHNVFVVINWCSTKIF